MGLFNNSEKTPEKALVDEIWEEIKLTLSVRSEKIKLIGIVEESYKKGATCDEIRKVYEENLPGYTKKPDDEIERLKSADSEPLPLKEKLIGFGFLALIAVIVTIVACAIFAPGNGDIRYDRVMVDGLEFHVPQSYSLIDSGEDSITLYQKYEDKNKSRNRKNRQNPTPEYYLDIYIFKNQTVEQALSYLEFDDDWEIQRNITYGAYTGVRADIIVWPFRNTVPQGFIFEKYGKTVAVFIDNEMIFKKGIEKIIS